MFVVVGSGRDSAGGASGAFPFLMRWVLARDERLVSGHSVQSAHSKARMTYIIEYIAYTHLARTPDPSLTTASSPAPTAHPPAPQPPTPGTTP